MLRKLSPGECPYALVDAVFDWSSADPKAFMSMVDICRAAGFDPEPGDCVSVSAHLKRRGIKRLKYRGYRGAMMPARKTSEVISHE